MRFRSIVRITAALLAALILLSAATLCSGADYKTYSAQNEKAVSGSGETLITAENCVNASDFEVNKDYEGKNGNSLILPAEKNATFRFTVPVSGKYTFVFTYFSGHTTASVTRDILLDGKLPFDESAQVSFPQLWVDETDEKVYDADGNQVRAKQNNLKAWIDYGVYDASGRISGELQYYLEGGNHNLTLTGGEEELLLHSIKVVPVAEIKSYKEMLEIYKEKGYKKASVTKTLEAEDGTVRSDRSMYSVSDRTTPTVTPYSASKQIFNAIGGTQWKLAGQWIEWEFEVTQDALYKIGTHFRQSDKVGDISVRECYIDGKLPFAEAANIAFHYDGVWQYSYFGNEKGEPYLFYLDAGKHTLRLKVGLGNIAESIVESEECLKALNSVYRRIVVITGSSPDPYRDYQLGDMIPEVFEEMAEIDKRLNKLEIAVAGSDEGSQSTVAISRLRLQLGKMIEDSDETTALLSSFQENISSFGTWINSRAEQPLMLDRIDIAAADAQEGKGEANFAQLLWHYLKQFVASFVTDYSAVGVMDTNADKNITVWIANGRDQSLILKQMINDNFTPDSNISVNLQLVTATALLPSIIAGTGPDVYMGMPQGEVINLALREALADVSKYKDYNNLTKRFSKEAMVPFTYNNSVWAIPDTMSFYMMFYRKDIIEELNIKTEDLKSWENILENVLPELQVNSLSFGMPVGINSYLTFLYQQKGNVYINDGRQSALSSIEAINCMKYFSKLYTQYGLPLAYDFANRFRSGEMPIAVVDYLQYNQLTVFAPEIKGLWGMLPVPGTPDSEGNISHATPSTLTGSIVLAKSKNKESAFKYLDWWTTADTQLEYGANLESIVGSAARYNSANLEAIYATGWSGDIKKQLALQIEELNAYPEVPGGYLTARYYDFAFRDIVYNDDNVRETMVDAVESINAEIAHKREEYNLD